jgi:medium-chain acyl-[acyl-carrier-protein] hydrolase
VPSFEWLGSRATDVMASPDNASGVAGASPMDARAWLRYRRSRPQPRLRLLCLPYAGVGASVFRTWSESLPPDIELCPIQLPGREERLMEPAFDRVELLVPCLVEAVSPILDLPFAIFGHSMGALLGFEFARQLRRLPSPAQPVHLFVSGHRAPQLPATTLDLHSMSVTEMADELSRLGTPAALALRERELQDLVLPTLKADFALCETYRYTPEPPLACPITAIWGERDLRVKPGEMAPWLGQTSSSFRLHRLPGGHIYSAAETDIVLRILSDTLGSSGGQDT